MNCLRVTDDYRTDGPLNLGSFLFIVQRPYNFVPRRDIPGGEIVGQSLSNVILLLDIRIQERHLLIQLMVVVIEMCYKVSVLEPAIR